MTKTLLTLTLALAALATRATAATLPAFPGAQGFGRHATGGRAGTVYHVTNLNDTGAGSLRDAISQPHRIIVFDVAGVIRIKERLVFKNNLTIAGQTAPGEGIIVYGNGVSFSGASNIIVRHLRFRMGKGGSAGKDCAGIANGHDMIFDHCSFAWGLDETFSINPSSGATCRNITIQNCIMGQGLLPHSAGGLMQTDSVTLYRNLYADNDTRNNKIKGAQQYVNNIVYNWSSGCLLMGGDSSGKSYVNATGNLFINGPSGGGNAITSGNADFHIHAADNLQDRNRNGRLDPYAIPRSEYSGGPTFQDQPYPYPQLDICEAKDLIEQSLPEVGASLPYRDLADCYMVRQVRSYGTEGALLSTEDQLPIGTPATWDINTFPKPADTDADGMPDQWETANGTDPNADDAMATAPDGYTNIERYINSLTTANRHLYLRQPCLAEATAATPTTITLAWADFTESEDAFVIEALLDGQWRELARTAPNAETATLDSLQPGTAYQLRITARKGSESSQPATLTARTKPEPADITDCDNFQPDDSHWLIAPDQDQTITLDTDVSKQAIVVRSDHNVTITGTGHITGAGSLNKAGSGQLTLSDGHTYTGATVLHGGTYAFHTLADGGQPSAIGASAEYAQNWIWDGGTWLYTGPSASTNRSARLLDDTELTIDQPATVAISGTIEGDGTLTISGQGTLAPASQKFFAWEGDTRLAGNATLKLAYVKAVDDKQIYLDDGHDKHRLILAGGQLKIENGNTLDLTYAFPIHAEEATTSTISICRNAHIKSDVTGSGTIDYRIPYVREYLEGDWTRFFGTLTATGCGTDKDGSQLMLQTGFKGFPNARLDLKGNTRLVSWKTNDTQYIGGLSGDQGTFLSGCTKKTDGATMAWHIGAAATDETFNGTIDNRCSASGHNAKVSIIKEGSGYWRLTGKNTYSGFTTVSGGTLIVDGSHSGTGTYTVTDGATLAGTGAITGASVFIGDGATLQSGTDTQTGPGLRLSKNLTVKAGGQVYIPTTDTEASTLTVNGKMTLEEGATLRLDEAGYLPDTALKLFAIPEGGITGTFAAITPAAPDDGLEWDTTTLYTDGCLRIRAVSGIATAPAAAAARGLLIKRQAGHTQKVVK